MLKRLAHLCLCAAFLLGLFGCAEKRAQDQDYKLELYYRQSAPVFGGESGILGTEERNFGAEVPTFDEIFTDYFDTPRSPTLSSPFPKGLSALGTTLNDGVLTVSLSEQFAGLTGVGHSVAVACIAKTVLQISGVDAVCLRYEGADAVQKQTPVLTAADFVSRDLGAFNSETSVRLYFSDPNGRYLVAEDRKNVFTDASQIPAYIVQQLIAGPTDTNLVATMPEGTRLIDLSIDDDGVCTVNLSSEFLYNRPTTELMERMCIYSMVNALTELEQIHAVRFLAEGKPIAQYLHMDLSLPYRRDESAKSIVRMGLNEFDATLFVKSWSTAQLAAVPVCVRRVTSSTQAEDLLLELLHYEGINGLENPVPDGTSIVSMEESNGVCHVDFSRDFLQCAGKESAELLAVRAVAATLCSLESITSVRISVLGKYEGLQYFDLSQPLIPNDKWYF